MLPHVSVVTSCRSKSRHYVYIDDLSQLTGGEIHPCHNGSDYVVTRPGGEQVIAEAKIAAIFLSMACEFKLTMIHKQRSA